MCVTCLYRPHGIYIVIVTGERWAVRLRRRCGSTHNHSYVKLIASSNVHATREIPFSYLLEVETENCTIWAGGDVMLARSECL